MYHVRSNVFFILLWALAGARVSTGSLHSIIFYSAKALLRVEFLSTEQGQLLFTSDPRQIIFDFTAYKVMFVV